MQAKKILTFIRKWSKEIFNLFLGFMLISGLFYIRLVPKISRDLWDHMNYSQIISTLINILLLILHIYYLGVLLNYILPKNDKKYLESLVLISDKFQKYILEVLQNFYQFLWYISDFFINKVFSYTYLHYNVIRKLAKHFNKKENFSYYCMSLMLIKFLPKVVFLIAFFCDVVLYQHLNATFKCLPLLLIPLLENFFIFVLQDFYDSHKNNIYSFVQKEVIENSDNANYSFIPKFQNNPPDFVSDFEDYFFNHYLVLREVPDTIISYKTWKYNHFPYYFINLILCVIRLFLFIYILIYGLN